MRKSLPLAIAIILTTSGCSSNKSPEGIHLKNSAPPAPNGIICSQFLGGNIDNTQTSNSSIFIKSADKKTTISFQLIMPNNDSKATIGVTKMINDKHENEDIFELSKIDKPKNHIILAISYLKDETLIFSWAVDNQKDEAARKFENFTPGSWEQILVNLNPQVNDCKQIKESAL